MFIFATYLNKRCNCRVTMQLELFENYEKNNDLVKKADDVLKKIGQRKKMLGSQRFSLDISVSNMRSELNSYNQLSQSYITFPEIRCANGVALKMPNSLKPIFLKKTIEYFLENPDKKVADYVKDKNVIKFNFLDSENTALLNDEFSRLFSYAKHISKQMKKIDDKHVVYLN